MTPTPGVPEEIQPGVVRVVAPNPGPMTGPGTNAYVVGDDAVVVVDPGPDDDTHLDAILAAVGGRTVVAVAVTHHHADHWPLASRLVAEVGAPIATHGHPALEAPDIKVAGGDVLAAGRHSLQAIHTPGHASDHVCWLLDDEFLLTGDHVMFGSTVVIAPPDGDMAAYLESLALTRDLRPARILPGHGAVIEDAVAVLDWYVSHRLEREAAVLAAVSEGAGSVDAVVAAVYTDVDPFLHPVARYSVLAHLLKLRDEARVTGSVPDGDVPAAEADAGAANPELPSSEPPGMNATWRPA